MKKSTCIGSLKLMKSYFNDIINDHIVVNMNNDDMTSFKMEVLRLYENMRYFQRNMNNYLDVFIRELEDKE